jgi:hypothetical protein
MATLLFDLNELEAAAAPTEHFKELKLTRVIVSRHADDRTNCAHLSETTYAPHPPDRPHG